MNTFWIAIWRDQGCKNGGFWLGKCEFYIVNNGSGAIFAVLMENTILGDFLEDFGAILETGGTTLASICMPGAVLGTAWKLSDFGTDPETRDQGKWVVNMVVRGATKY